MNALHPYHIVVVLGDVTDGAPWMGLAERLLVPPGEIELVGMVTIPPGQSLSEGALQAQRLRQVLTQAAQAYPYASADDVQVDYQPLAHVLARLKTAPADVLVVQWRGPMETTGGLSTDALLQDAPCDVALVSGAPWQAGAPALLLLRGGPNRTLGLRVARALAAGAGVSLLHAADHPRAVPDLRALFASEPEVLRVVTAVSPLTDSVQQEAPRHKAIVLGATFSRQTAQASAVGPIVRRIYEEVPLPLVLVRAWQPESVDFYAPPASAPPRAEDLSTRVDRWFAEKTFHSHEFQDVRALLALKEKQGVTISVGLPALNEAGTVGLVIDTLQRTLMREVPLVDELVLIDSDSTDDTVAIAESYGIPAYRHSEILPELGSYRGKGEALWKSLAVLRGDLVVWIDTDITNIHPRFVYGLLGPLLQRPGVQYVKGFYHRPIVVDGQLHAFGGGRVTELVARPLLNLYYPELSGFVQPLAGEYAGRRAALEAVPFFVGYGVETGLLIDLHERFGLPALAQTDLEQRVHHNQPLVGLSKMSFALMQVFSARLERRYGLELLKHASRSMKLIAYGEDRFALDINEIVEAERPPMLSVPAYQRARSGLARLRV